MTTLQRSFSAATLFLSVFKSRVDANAADHPPVRCEPTLRMSVTQTVAQISRANPAPWSHRMASLSPPPPVPASSSIGHPVCFAKVAPRNFF